MEFFQVKNDSPNDGYWKSDTYFSLIHSFSAHLKDFVQGGCTFLPDEIYKANRQCRKICRHIKLMKLSKHDASGIIIIIHGALVRSTLGINLACQGERCKKSSSPASSFGQ